MFGGSFDPPHLAHLKIIKDCAINFDILVIVPTNKSPLKDHFPKANFNERFEMINLMISGVSDNIIIDKYEASTDKKTTYTIDTIEHLTKKYNVDKISLVLGSDQLINFRSWKNFDKLITLVDIICFKRSGFPFISMDIRYEKNRNINMEFSSSKIRKMINKGNDNIEKFISKSVSRYIIQNELYC